ncbi:MAG: hypothetical protein WD227_18625, partial [Vicinamibacterales bacterium]
IGRAAVQKLVPIENRGLWLTYARYQTPTGDLIHGKGLKPDVAIEEPEVDVGSAPPTSDPVLDAALKRVKLSSMM